MFFLKLTSCKCKKLKVVRIRPTEREIFATAITRIIELVTLGSSPSVVKANTGIKTRALGGLRHITPRLRNGVMRRRVNQPIVPMHASTNVPLFPLITIFFALVIRSQEIQ